MLFTISILIISVFANFPWRLDYLTTIIEKIESTSSLLENVGFFSGEILVSLNNKLVVQITIVHQITSPI